MVKSITISLAGYSGAGKTTLLKYFDKNCILLGERTRKPTEEEIRSWSEIIDEIPNEISTSSIPNFGQTILRNTNGKYEFDRFHNSPSGKDIVIKIVDTCGQEMYYPFRKQSLIGTDGIIFLIDMSLNLVEHKEQVKILYEELKTYFEKIPPIMFIFNKIDTYDNISDGQKIVYKKLIISYIKELRNYPIYYGSALLGNGMFENLAKLVTYILTEDIKRCKICIEELKTFAEIDRNLCEDCMNVENNIGKYLSSDMGYINMKNLMKDMKKKRKI